VPTEIPIPKNEADFERMCANVYGVVFEDPKPKINGRKGQAQGGVDVFVNAKGIGRIGVQCKKYFRTDLKWKDVEEEVKKADKHKTPIKILLIATTSPSDASLLHEVQLLSDSREAQGQFTIEIEFWEDIENRINNYASLQDNYAPHSPGAAYHRQDQKLDRCEQKLDLIQELIGETPNKIVTFAELPTGRDDSVNKIITAQLDRTNELLKKSQYKDALAYIASIGKDLGSFDSHQKARWHLQRGLCLWFSSDDIKEAAALFLKAADLYPDDEKMAAARIRGLMLNENIDAALEAGRLAIERFPLSQIVWLAYINTRVMKGETISISDIPSTMHEEPDVLQMLAFAARRHNNFSEAVSLSKKAAAHQEAGFFTRSMALNMVIEDVARNTVAAAYGLLSQVQLDDLDRVIALFEPRHERLWLIQSGAVETVAAQLGFAYLLRRNPNGALGIVMEAEALGLKSKELFRVHIMALSELNRIDEALELGRTHLADMTKESIVVVSELAANCGDVKFLEGTLAYAKSFLPDWQETVDTLSALRWLAITRAGDKDRALREIADANIAESNNLILVCSVARLLNNAGESLEAAVLINRAKSLIGAEDTHEFNRLMLADLLFNAKRWMEAAALYETLTPIGQISELHIRLFTCYVEADSRKKAKYFLSQLPDDWVENDEIRRLAMNLGQNAGDWKFLLPLSETQVRKAPTEGISWLFKLHVASKVETPAAFQDMVRQVPEELSGSIRNLAQLASLELRYDEMSRGLRRLYRLVRQNFDEPEAFSAYYIGIIAAPIRLPLMEETMPAAVAGSSLTLVNDVGHELQVVIDPSDVGTLPKRTHFLKPDSSEAAALIGAKIGQIVAVPTQAFGGTQNFTVISIQSAYRRLLHIAQEHAESLGGLPNMKSVPIGTSGDGVKDFTRMLEELKRSTERTRQILEAYGAGTLTLSGFAKMQGRTTIEVAIGWPLDAPPIFIGTGLAEERDEALAALARTDAIYVTDALTLTELVNFGVPEVLAALSKIYISPFTMETLEHNLRDAMEDKSVGTAIDVDGQLGFIEYDDKHKEQRIAFAKELVGVAKKYCTVQPAYSELTPPTEVPQFVNILKEEEREMLMLAKDYNATLLTLDGRLRMLAKAGIDVNGLWPQVLLMHCLARGQIKPEKSAEFTVKEFLTNRKFVSLSPMDLVWMVMQGDNYIQRGIQALKRYLESSETDFESASKMVLEFLVEIAQLNTQLGAFRELLGHIIEPLFRRKDCPLSFHGVVEKFVYDLPENFAGVPHAYPPVNLWREQNIQMQRKYLADEIVNARKRSATPLEIRPIAVRVLCYSKIPTLILDKNVSGTIGNNRGQTTIS
jgi:tetratricopeptide (TPR) repeat protein